ncbi:hypothetical protein D3C81_1392400 [compost metagenome]
MDGLADVIGIAGIGAGIHQGGLPLLAQVTLQARLKAASYSTPCIAIAGSTIRSAGNDDFVIGMNLIHRRIQACALAKPVLHTHFVLHAGGRLEAEVEAFGQARRIGHLGLGGGFEAFADADVTAQVRRERVHHRQ